MSTLYQQLARHYQGAIGADILKAGDRMPSVRELARVHSVSLSTALQVLRHLEKLGFIEARPRSGYFVCLRADRAMPPALESTNFTEAGPAAFVGIHERVSKILTQGQQAAIRVNLALAVGDNSLYPTAELARSMQRLLRAQPKVLTTMARRHGHPELRNAVALRALGRGVRAAPEEVIVTHGCIEAINLALRAVTRPGDAVAVESPTFYGLLQILESLGLRAVEIPTSPATGMSLDALAFALSQATDSAIRAVVCMPTFHNPLGCVMPDENKQRLVALCAQHDIALVEDDIYGEMGAPYKPAKAFDVTGHVIYCNSLNKLIAPGFRLGWMLGGRWHARLEMLKYTQSRYGEELPQQVAAEFLLSQNYQRYLTRMRSALDQQREQMAAEVARSFPEGTRLSPPQGGMVLWIQLPGAVRALEVFDLALAKGVKIAPGCMFSNSSRYDHCLRLSASQVHGEAVAKAVRTVGDIVRLLAA